LRSVVIQGTGSSFCSGAEVTSWKAEELQVLLKSLVECPLPTIAYVHGVCLGGGMGLAGASDFVLAEEGTKFGFPEVRIGMVPAVISPYVARKLSLGRIRELFITGEIFDSSQALSMGFLYAIENKGEDIVLSALISDIEKGGPNAQASIKRLLNGDILYKKFEERDKELAEFISLIREGSESQEGIRSFLEKRKPEWCRDDS
jgi:methylglutaconyl-CoA hydratase